MYFDEMVKRLRVVRQRIQEKNYPMPNIYLPPNWEYDTLDEHATEQVLKKYEEYEKRMDFIRK
jgi:hypothetical protein